MTSSQMAEAVEQLQNTIRTRTPAARFQLVDIREDENEQTLGILVYSDAGPWELSEIVAGEISSIIAKQGLSICVVAAPPEVREEEQIGPTSEIRTMLEQPLGTSVHLTREQAAAIVDAGIGGRPDLPPGTQYVRQIREAWRGLTGRGSGSA